MNRMSSCYSDELVLEVVKRVKRGELSVTKAREAYGIGGKMTIQKWVSKYGAMVEECNPKGGLVTNKRKQAPAESKEKALKEAVLKLEMYENIFALAKEEYGVDFKKILAACVTKVK